MTQSRSKKRSDASCTAKPPDKPTYFIDRSLGCVHLPEAFRKAGIKFIVHDDHFPADAKDEEWLSKAGECGWIVLTKDDKIRYRPLERMALMGAGVAAFIFSARNIKGSETAALFIQCRTEVEKFLKKTKRPFIARITRAGEVSLLES